MAAAWTAGRASASGVSSAPNIRTVRLRITSRGASGIEAFRERYAAVFRDRPRVHAELAGRLVLGRFVIDHERITDGDEHSPDEALAIYEVDGDRISRMWFIEPAERR